MPKYRATRFSNSRSVETAEFIAVDDETAKAYLTGDLAIHELNWNYEADSECEPDTVLDLDRYTNASWDVVTEGIVLNEHMPYSWDAIEFVKKVAALRDDADDEDDLKAIQQLILEARQLCGQDREGA